MSLDDISDAQTRTDAIQRQTEVQRWLSTASAVEETNRLYTLESTVARIQAQIAPGIVNALREQTTTGIIAAQIVQNGIAEAARDALRLQEVERGIAEMMRRAADPIRDSILTAQDEINRFLARLNATTTANFQRLQEPLWNLNEYFRTISQMIAEPLAAQVSAMQRAAQGIATIYEFTKPRAHVGSELDADEPSISDDELAALFERAFPDDRGSIDPQAFEHGVDTIVAAIHATKDSRLQKAMAQYVFPLLLVLLTIFLSSGRPKELPAKAQSEQTESTTQPEPKARVERHKFAVVTADIANLRKDHSKDSPIIGKLKKSERVRVIQRQDLWTEIETGRTSGWVATKYLKPDDSQPATR